MDSLEIDGQPIFPQDRRTGPERAGLSIEPKAPRSLTELRRDSYDTDSALEVFESLLLIAAGIPVRDDPNRHPLVLAQAAKGLIGLRPERPSQRLMDFALEMCSTEDSEPVDRELLRVAPEELGMTVAVHELEEAIRAGDLEEAYKQTGRLLMVSDNRALLFDLLLEIAAGRDDTAARTVPFIHSAQRAMDFVGPRNLADFYLPALEVAAGGQSGAGEVATGGDGLTTWDVLPYLGEAPLEVVLLAAHTAQIAADEHLKLGGIMSGLERTLAALVEPLGEPKESSGRARKGDVQDLIEDASEGEQDLAGAIGRHLGHRGDRGWLLEVVEAVEEARLTADLVLWADAFRMLYRAALEEDYGLLGEVAGVILTRI
ncbi:MAG: hypothetical protein JSU61_00045 [Fidelibacterota bacterium]|nr:MAG: hypothetical protein JSU61_00045 [Candidatus Neomarinimicrobiota bacterium]